LERRQLRDICLEPLQASARVRDVFAGEQSRDAAELLWLEVLSRQVGLLEKPATGAGKSQPVRHMLEQLSGVDTSWLVIEPAKAEYSKMATRLGASGKVSTLRIGDPSQVAVGLNPLEPESGFRLQSTVGAQRQVMEALRSAEQGSEAAVLIGDRESPIVAAVRQSGAKVEAVLDPFVAAPDTRVAVRIVERMLAAIALEGGASPVQRSG
jgi:hypothetical protein